MDYYIIPDEVGVFVCFYTVHVSVWVGEWDVWFHSPTWTQSSFSALHPPGVRAGGQLCPEAGVWASWSSLLLIKDLRARSCCLLWHEWDADIFGSVPLQELWQIPFCALKTVGGTVPDVVHTDLVSKNGSCWEALPCLLIATLMGTWESFFIIIWVEKTKNHLVPGLQSEHVFPLPHKMKISP